MDNNIPKGCKPFDLQKAMAGEPVVTRDGRPYKFGAYNPEAQKDVQLIGWIDGVVNCHYSNGSYNSTTKGDRDLFMAAKTQKVWVNLWRNETGDFVTTVFQSEAGVALDLSKPGSCIFLKTIETEVEL